MLTWSEVSKWHGSENLGACNKKVEATAHDNPSLPCPGFLFSPDALFSIYLGSMLQTLASDSGNLGSLPALQKAPWPLNSPLVTGNLPRSVQHLNLR